MKSNTYDICKTGIVFIKSVACMCKNCTSIMLTCFHANSWHTLNIFYNYFLCLGWENVHHEWVWQCCTCISQCYSFIHMMSFSHNVLYNVIIKNLIHEILKILGTLEYILKCQVFNTGFTTIDGKPDKGCPQWGNLSPLL